MFKNYVYFVQDCNSPDPYDFGIRFTSLKKAVAYAIESKDTAFLIHNGAFNFDYYRYGDTFETLYARCKAMEKEWWARFQ